MSPSDEEHRIIAKASILDERYLPEVLAAREAQINELAWCLSPALRKERPMHSWLHGPPGCGKTSVARYVLEALQEQVTVPWTYVNCWTTPTLHSIADSISKDLRILSAQVQSTSSKLEKLGQYIGNRVLVVILDEIDRTSPSERNSILYNFCEMGNIGLVCTASSRYALHLLEDRVKSRLNPIQIEFGHYRKQALVAILSDRAERALVPEGWSRRVIEEIARLAEGNARTAIQTLRFAAHYAEREHSTQLTIAHARKASANFRALKKLYALRGMTRHHRLLYRIIKERGEIESSDLWKEYLSTCEASKLRPIASRTYSLYISQLIEARLIRSDRARGRARVFRIGNNLDGDQEVGKRA